MSRNEKLLAVVLAITMVGSVVAAGAVFAPQAQNDDPGTQQTGQAQDQQTQQTSYLRIANAVPDATAIEVTIGNETVNETDGVGDETPDEMDETPDDGMGDETPDEMDETPDEMGDETPDEMDETPDDGVGDETPDDGVGAETPDDGVGDETTDENVTHFGPVAAGEVSEYQNVSTGTHNVTVRLANASDQSEPLYEGNITIEARNVTTLAFTGEFTSEADTDIEPVMFEDDAFAPSDEEGAVRAIHASPDLEEELQNDTNGVDLVLQGPMQEEGADGVGDETPGDGMGDETPSDGIGDETPDDGVGDETPGDGIGEETPGDETPGDDGMGDETPDDGIGDETPETPDDGVGDETPGDGIGDETPEDDGIGDETPGDDSMGDETPDDGVGDGIGDETPETPGDGVGDETPDDGVGQETPDDGVQAENETRVIAENVSFRNATDYMNVPAGEYTLEIRESSGDDNGSVVETFDVTVEGGSAQTILLYGYEDPFDSPAGASLNATVVEDAAHTVHLPGDTTEDGVGEETPDNETDGMGDETPDDGVGDGMGDETPETPDDGVGDGVGEETPDDGVGDGVGDETPETPDDGVGAETPDDDGLIGDNQTAENESEDDNGIFGDLLGDDDETATETPDDGGADAAALDPVL